jgi:hypothetical protein
MKIAISSGHGKYIRGASGAPVPPELDEVDEARLVVEEVADRLRAAGIECVTFHDDTSHDQSTNLATIVNWHNGQSRDLDCSVHFNAYDGSAHGCEVLYLTQQSLAGVMAAAIAAAGPFTNRGPKYRSDLYFLNNTEQPAVLVETCFCDHTGDSNNYHENFAAICEAIAESMSGRDVPDEPGELPPQTPDFPSGRNRVEVRTTINGPVSTFVNGSLVQGTGQRPSVEYTVALIGDVVCVVNGEEFHNRLNK